MIDNIGESIKMAKIFCFASGQTLTIDDDKIGKIPYLAALVSSADCFESVYDEHGYYKLDLHIEYKYFSFILESISFHSVRQLFTHLPKQYDVIHIIALLDFLGIGPQPDPALREVDSTFFSNLVFSPFLEGYLLQIRPSVIQDMAVRFAIAMAKEEYNFNDHKVIDQIYWFIMFILSAYKLFGSRLRHHVYQIAENCFSLFEPLLLKRLKKLIQRTQEGENKFRSITNENAIDPDENSECSLEQAWDIPSDDWCWFSRSTLKERQDLIANRTYTSYHTYWISRSSHSQQYIEAASRRVLEITYERLQSAICQRALIAIHNRNNFNKIVDKCGNLLLPSGLGSRTDCFVLPKEVSDIWKHEQIEKEIRELILEEIYLLKPKLEQRRNELVTQIREYDQSQEILDEDAFNPFHLYLLFRSTFESLQEEALSYVLLLDNLNQGSSTEEEIYQRVLDGLYTNARKQFIQWSSMQKTICKLYDKLSSCQETINIVSMILNTTYPKYQIPVYKPLPKCQRKYSIR
ncbi:unnamed protein product [Rotaria socialis]|uniref:Uncharacterized protein n=1 Tax=Rotaria socialis TaxID=392032 RepID=A0A818WRG3_9BILA|nr:unnamed protein product [Rotaria socialis]CAF3728838.1 unnamed protein product [Rotaria socialis]CAF4274866.1 unnamed protein product [Rotaria socialis]